MRLIPALQASGVHPGLRTMIDEHMEVDAKTEGESNDHTKVLGPNNNINKKEAIVPEEELMTENTSDLKRILEAIPMELLNMDEKGENMQTDYLDILNKCESPKEHYKCEKCKLKNTSSRNL